MATVRRQAWIFSLLTLLFVISAAVIMSMRVSEAEQVYGELVMVLVAKRDIPAHTTLTPDLLDQVEMPARFVGSTLLTSEETALRQTTVVALKKGDYITHGTLRSPNEMNPDRRAFTLIGSSKVLIEPSIRPGDRVDVLGAYHDRATNEDIVSVIVPSAEVLSVSNDEKQVYVTLTLTVEQSQSIMKVENFGQQLRLLKRGA